MSQSGKTPAHPAMCSLLSCFIARSMDTSVIAWLSCRLVELLEKREDNGGEWQQQKTKRGRDEGALLTPSGQIFIDEVQYCCTAAAALPGRAVL